MALEITWHRLGVNPNMPGNPILSEKITLSGTSAAAAVAPDGAEVVRIEATENARYATGPAPTATAAAGANGHFLGSGKEIWLPVRAGVTKIAGIQPA